MRLADRLVAGGIEDEDVQSEIWWQTWYAAADEALRAHPQVAGAVSHTIDTKFCRVEVDGSELVDLTKRPCRPGARRRALSPRRRRPGRRRRAG